MRDVTKTKASHHRPPVSKAAAAAAGPAAPTTFEGIKLADEVRKSGHADDVKARLVREIVEYEGSHGSCTQTFQRKVRKQIRPKG